MQENSFSEPETLNPKPLGGGGGVLGFRVFSGIDVFCGGFGGL